MKFSEYEKLKVGDIVSPSLGRNKGQKAIVVGIWDITDTDGYREILISANFIDSKLSTVPEKSSDMFISYRALTKES